MILQTTLAEPIEVIGVGMHSGKRVRLHIRPAPPDTGFVFRRTDLAGAARLRVSPAAITDTQMATTLGSAPNQVRTIEHLLSACAGVCLDNAEIEIDAEEVPILDGSAASFVYLLKEAGLVQQRRYRRYIRVLKPVEVCEGSGAQLKWAGLHPHNGYRLRFEIEFSHPAVSASGQTQSFDFDTGHYDRDVSRARTFGFTTELEWLRSKGLGLGGSLDNAIVMDDRQVLNAGGLRDQDEFVKHKILDAIGDMAVAGYALLAEYSAFRGGHGLNNQLLRKLFSDAGQFEWVHRDAAGSVYPADAPFPFQCTLRSSTAAQPADALNDTVDRLVPA